MLKHYCITVFCNRFFLICYFKADYIKIMIIIKNTKVVFFIITAFVKLILIIINFVIIIYFIYLI